MKKTIDVQCPTCRANVGEKCMRLQGLLYQDMNYFHSARVLDAINVDMNPQPDVPLTK